MKKALITGVTGQDGSYLAEFLLDKGYESTVLNAVHRPLIQSVLITFMKIRTMKIRIFICTTVI